MTIDATRGCSTRVQSWLILFPNRSDKLILVGSVPLYLELHIPHDYPDAAPQPDLSNINNAPYAPAVKDQAIAQIKAEVSDCTGTYAHCLQHNVLPSCMNTIHGIAC